MCDVSLTSKNEGLDAGQQRCHQRLWFITVTLVVGVIIVSIQCMIKALCLLLTMIGCGSLVDRLNQQMSMCTDTASFSCQRPQVCLAE